MTTLVKSLLLCLGLITWGSVGADTPPASSGDSASLDRISPAPGAMADCCPQGAPDQTGPAPSAPAPQGVAKAPPDTKPCKTRPGKGARGDAGKPCQTRAASQPCLSGPDKPCRQPACEDKGPCNCPAGRSKHGRGDDGDDMASADLRARLHQMEKRLDLMQNLLESMLERQGRPGGGPHSGH